MWPTSSFIVSPACSESPLNSPLKNVLFDLGSDDCTATESDTGMRDFPITFTSTFVSATLIKHSASDLCPN